MRSLLNGDDRQALCARVCELTEASVPRWGRMDVAGMLGHLCNASYMALGELRVTRRGSDALRVFPAKHVLKYLLLYVVPFPKGAGTSPELIVSEPGQVGENKALLQSLLERFGAGPTEGPGPEHGLLGTLSRREWGVLVYKHVDHHLRQFGV